MSSAQELPTKSKTHLDSMLLDGFLDEPVSTGTTIMAVEYKDGVVIGADSRTSSGSYVANRFTDKLTQITDQIFVCRSGSAADTQAIADIVAYHLDFYQAETGEPASVELGAQLFRDLCYNYRHMVTAGVICAGWDRRKGPQVYSVPVGGMISREKIAIGGSGSTYIYGFVDSQYKTDMSKEECCNLVLKAISLAISRDGHSGGVCRMAIIDKNGVERKTILGNQLPKFY